MSYKTDALKAYVELNTKKKERLNAIREEVSKIEKNIAAKQEKYTEALRNDDDEAALKLLEEINKLRNEARFKSDKAEMLGNGEETVKNERAAAAMVEYNENLKRFKKIVAEEEAELKEIEEQYITKVNKIVNISKVFSNIQMRYEHIPAQMNDRHGKLLFNTNHVINPVTYKIDRPWHTK